MVVACGGSICDECCVWRWYDGGDGVGVSRAVVVMSVVCGDGGDDGGGVWRQW